MTITYLEVFTLNPTDGETKAFCVMVMYFFTSNYECHIQERSAIHTHQVRSTIVIYIYIYNTTHGRRVTWRAEQGCGCLRISSRHLRKSLLTSLNITLHSAQSNMTVLCESDRCYELNTTGEYTFAKTVDARIMYTTTNFQHAVFNRAYLRSSNFDANTCSGFHGCLSKRQDGGSYTST